MNLVLRRHDDRIPVAAMSTGDCDTGRQTADVSAVPCCVVRRWKRMGDVPPDGCVHDAAPVSRVVAATFASACMITASAAQAAAAAPGLEGRKPPAEWDARLADRVDHVERARGFDFKHPVRFLIERQSGRQFKKVAAGQGELSRQNRAGLQRQAGFSRALGPIEANGGCRERGPHHASAKTMRAHRFGELPQQRARQRVFKRGLPRARAASRVCQNDARASFW
jgi:hypothetical protein